MILMTLWLLVMTCRVCKASSEACTSDGTSLLTVRDAGVTTAQDSAKQKLATSPQIWAGG